MEKNDNIKFEFLREPIRITDQQWDASVDQFVSIFCATYDHEPYIKDAIEGFLMQKTTFPVKIVIFEDCSTDNTAGILREYEVRYPQLFAVFYQPENTYHDRGKRIEALKPCNAERNKAKYIAMCEGDDYWTDPLKLQKQVEFLEQHSDYVFCCHRFKIYRQDTGIFLNEYGNDLYVDGENLEITWDVFSKYWVTQTLTTLIRTKEYCQVSKMNEKYKYRRDVHAYYSLLKIGKGISLNKTMGVYRWHSGGVASLINLNDKKRTAYNIYKELYEENNGDIYCRYKYFDSVSKLMTLLPYFSIKEKVKLFKEGFVLHKGTKELVRLWFFMLFPPKLSKIVNKILVNKNLKIRP